MLSRIVEILSLLIRLLELDSGYQREEPDSEKQIPEVRHLDKSSPLPEVSVEHQHRPLALQAPANPATTEASPSMPKKRGRPPKVNRTEDSSNS
jgi:hypothetical protein